MKKLFIPLVVITSSIFTVSAFAKNDAQLLVEAQKNVWTISQATKAADETGVTVKGIIVGQLTNDQYEVKDSTGTIIVEIDHDLALPQDLPAGTELTILAEVDTSRTKPTSLDAVRVDIAKKTAPLAAKSNINTTTQKVTVAEALKAKDESLVTLKGEIVRHIKGDDYEIKDSTGTIRVDIDDSLASVQSLKAGTQVTIIAEVDESKFKATKLDVQQITIH